LGNLGTCMPHKTAWRFGKLPTPEVGETPCIQHRRSGAIIAHAYSSNVRVKNWAEWLLFCEFHGCHSALFFPRLFLCALRSAAFGGHSNSHSSADWKSVKVSTVAPRFRATKTPNFCGSICSGLLTNATFILRRANTCNLSPRRNLSGMETIALYPVVSMRSLLFFVRSQCSAIDSNCCEPSPGSPAPINLAAR